MALTQRKNVGYGQNQPLVDVFPTPIVAQRDPVDNDRAEAGTIWVNAATNDSFVAAATTANVTNWTNIAGGAAEFDQLTVAGAGPVDIDVTGVVSIDSDAASNFSVAGAGVDLTLEAAGGSINITASEADLNAITISATAAGGGVAIDGFDLLVLRTSNDPGNVTVTAAISTDAGAGGTLDAFAGVNTITGLTTAAAAVEVITITNDNVLGTSGILVTASNKGANDAQMTVTRVVPVIGSFDITLTNNGAAALNGDLLISFWVLS